EIRLVTEIPPYVVIEGRSVRRADYRFTGIVLRTVRCGIGIVALESAVETANRSALCAKQFFPKQIQVHPQIRILEEALLKPGVARQTRGDLLPLLRRHAITTRQSHGVLT